MRNRSMIVIFVTMALLGSSLVLFGQRGGGGGAAGAAPAGQRGGGGGGAAAAGGQRGAQQGPQPLTRQPLQLSKTPPNPNFDTHDISGYWSRNLRTFVRDAPACDDCGEGLGGYGFGVNVPPMTPEGKKRFDANKTGKGLAPDSPQALANPQLDIGRRRGVPPAQGNDPQATCNPDGIPRLLMMTPAPYEIVMNKDRMFQFFEWTWAHREVWMDGRVLPDKIDYVPRWFGYSVGKWDGDVYVVNSIGFDDRSWVDSFGYPHSDSMKLEERYHLRDHDTLELQVTITDPVIYTKPWVSEVKVNKRVPKDKMVLGGWQSMAEDICATLDEVDLFNTIIRDPAGGLKK